MRNLFCAALLLFAVSAAADEKRDAALAMVSRLGGTVTLDGTKVVKVDLKKTAATDDDIALLAALPELRELNVFRTAMTDKGLAALEDLEHLETLLMGGTKVTDAGLAALLDHPRLKKISVFDTQIGDAAIPHLAKLGALRVLVIGKSKVTEEGAKRLQAAIAGLSFTEL